MSKSPTPAQILLDQASRARRDNRLTGALRDCGDAVSAARSAGDVDALITSLRMLGQIERDMGRPAQALAPYQEAVALCRTMGAKSRLAHTVRHLGDLLVELNRPGDAAAEYEAALVVYRKDSNTGALDLANTLRGYALAKEILGESQVAGTTWREALQSNSDLGIEAGVAECSEHLKRLSDPADMV